MKYELQYKMRRSSLYWSKKANNFPDVGQVWTSHRDDTLWLILMVGRIDWKSWAFEVMNLETADIEVLHVNNTWDQKKWIKHS